MFAVIHEPGIEAYVLLGMIIAAFVFTRLLKFWKQRQKNERNEQKVRALLGASFKELRKNPELLPPCPEEVSKIGYTHYANQSKLEELSGNRRAPIIYESFFFMKEGGVQVLERLADAPSIKDNASWLAEQWGVPYEVLSWTTDPHENDVSSLFK